MQALKEMAERVRVRVADTTLVDEKCNAIAPSLSIGVAEMGGEETLANWIRRADEALYLAKSGGRNRCVFAPPVRIDVATPDANTITAPVLEAD